MAEHYATYEQVILPQREHADITILPAVRIGVAQRKSNFVVREQEQVQDSVAMELAPDGMPLTAPAE